MAESNFNFKKGKWINSWVFSTDKNPFNKRMAPAAIIKTMGKIQKHAIKPLKDRKAWKAINKEFNSLIPQHKWEPSFTKNGLTLVYSVKLIEAGSPPDKAVVAPPPPTQPPPPRVLG